MTHPDLNGDDLDDGLDYDVDFETPSGVESDNGEVEPSDVEQTTEDLDESPKFKRQLDAASTDSANVKKRKPTDSKFKEKKRLKMEMDLENKRKISTEPSTEIISDYINQIVGQKNKKLSTLELSDLYLSKNDIRSTSDFTEPRTLNNLSTFITSKFNNMLPASKKDLKKIKNQKNTTTQSNERKFISILSMSAIRACDVHRATRDFSGSSLKLINKNKLNVDLKLIGTTNSRVLCCTPGRLLKVLETEDSKLNEEEIKIIILDNSYLDQKGQNIWDIPETIQLLKKLTSSGSKIYLY